MEIKYSVIPSSEHPKIEEADDAFTNLENRWKELSSIKEWKVLVLNADNKLLSEISFLPKRKLLTRNELTDMFEIIKAIEKEKEKAAKIIVTKNHPKQDLFPTNQEKALAEEIEEYGKKHDIEVIDQMIVKSGMYYSFKMNS